MALTKVCKFCKAHAGSNRKIDIVIQKHLLSIIETKYIEGVV